MRLKALQQRQKDLAAEGKKLTAIAPDQRTAEQQARLAAIVGIPNAEGVLAAGELDQVATEIATEQKLVAAERAEILRDDSAREASPHVQLGATSTEQLLAALAALAALPGFRTSRVQGRRPSVFPAAGGFTGPAPWGQFLQAVARAATPGGVVDPRLYADATGGAAGVPGEGGFLIRPTWSDMLLRRMREESQLLPLCDSIPIGEGSDSFEAPYLQQTDRSAASTRFAGVQVYRRAEADTVTATKIDQFKKFELRLEDMMGIGYITDRLLQDVVAMQAWVENQFASAGAFKVDDELIRGTGNAQCLGVLNAPSLVSVAKETGQAAATVVTTNLSKMWNRLLPRYRGAAQWFVNADVEPQLDELTIPAGTAAVEPRFVNYGPDGILRMKGKPVVALEHCETLGTKGDIILANFGEYLVIDKGGLQMADSIHVRFLYGERTFRFLWRFNGQPKDPAAVTPYKGSATRSAFVALDTRA